jgi:hypothetical protein
MKPMTRAIRANIKILVEDITQMAEGVLAMRDADLGGPVSDHERRKTYRELGFAFINKAIDRFETTSSKESKHDEAR